jgi:hypothetical protein
MKASTIERGGGRRNHGMLRGNTIKVATLKLRLPPEQFVPSDWATR